MQLVSSEVVVLLYQSIYLLLFIIYYLLHIIYYIYRAEWGNRLSQPFIYAALRDLWNFA